jgi:hypothetical protein
METRANVLAEHFATGGPQTLLRTMYRPPPPRPDILTPLAIKIVQR